MRTMYGFAKVTEERSESSFENASSAERKSQVAFPEPEPVLANGEGEEAKQVEHLEKKQDVKSGESLLKSVLLRNKSVQRPEMTRVVDCTGNSKMIVASDFPDGKKQQNILEVQTACTSSSMGDQHQVKMWSSVPERSTASATDIAKSSVSFSQVNVQALSQPSQISATIVDGTRAYASPSSVSSFVTSLQEGQNDFSMNDADNNISAELPAMNTVTTQNMAVNIMPDDGFLSTSPRNGTQMQMYHPGNGQVFDSFPVGMLPASGIEGVDTGTPELQEGVTVAIVVSPEDFENLIGNQM